MQGSPGHDSLVGWAGTARIAEVAVTNGRSVVTLERPSRDRFELILDAVPDESSATQYSNDDQKPLAVLVVCRSSTFGCSLLVRSRRGPRRVEVSLELALALCRSGVHGVFRRDESSADAAPVVPSPRS